MPVRCSLLLIFFVIAFCDISGTIRTVPGDYPSIRDAIEAAVNGDTVLVAEGTYIENLVITKKILLASHFILDSNPSHIRNTVINGFFPVYSDTGSTILIYGDTDTNTVITGFTITGGLGTKLADGNWTGYEGGGVALFGGGMKLCHNIIKDNIIAAAAATEGGGICMWPAKNAFNYWIIEDNIISGNELACSSSVSYMNAAGAGVYLVGNGRFVRNIVSRNKGASVTTLAVGGAIFIHGGISDTSRILIEGNYISGNVSKSAAVVASFMEMAGLPKVDFINNIITANSNTVSGASLLRFLMGYYKFINNTIAENTSTYLASFTLSSNAQNSEAVFFNNIIWNTTVDTGFGFLSGNIKLFYNIVRGGFQGEGNLDTDPLFEAGDTLYSVQAASPALNAGRSSFSYNSAVINSPPDDYLRNLRPSPQGTNPDLGALELPPVASGIKLYDTQSFKYLLFQNYPNPFNPSTKINYQIPMINDQRPFDRTQGRPMIKVSLKVYDVMGREVATLVNEEKAPGSYEIEFNSSRVDNPRYKVISSGIYFYQLRAGNDVVITRKMILMK